MIKTIYTFDDIAKAWFAGMTGWAALAGFFGYSSMPARFRAVEVWSSLPVLCFLVLVCVLTCLDIKLNPHAGEKRWHWIKPFRKWMYFTGAFCLTVPLFTVARQGVDMVSLSLYVFTFVLSTVMGIIDGHRGRDGGETWL